MPSRHVRVGGLTLGNDLPLVFIVGPNTLESRAHALETGMALAEIAGKLRIGLIYKTSFDKANRTSLSGERGIGLREGLPILADLREATGLPVLTDIHAPEQCAPVAEVVDVLQTPAFLCRQTDLLLAAGKAGKPVNVKKGQFLAPWDMQNVAAKIASTGNDQILLCERGAMFGYNNLVVDMRSLAIMRDYAPVVFDGTHSIQTPSAQDGVSGGQPEFIPVLMRAAVAAGVDGIFLEVHDDPARAKSDGANALDLKKLKPLLETLLAIHNATDQ